MTCPLERKICACAFSTVCLLCSSFYQVMEARELVDQEDDQERLVKLHSANKQRQAAIVSQLSQAFAARDAEAAKQLVAQLSYWVRLEEAICEKL